jgi:TatA/E family protein of Tat protein translocase
MEDVLALFDSPESWIWLALIGAVLFGSSKLPELARSLGRSKNAFQKGLREGSLLDPGSEDDPEDPSRG